MPEILRPRGARTTTSRHAADGWPRELAHGGYLRQHPIRLSDTSNPNASVRCTIRGHEVACPRAAERVRCDACGVELPGLASPARI